MSSSLAAFAKLAARVGAVSRVAPGPAAGDTSSAEKNPQRNQCDREAVAPVAPVSPENDVILRESDWNAMFEERAAIIEYDGGFSRHEAEARARAEIDALREGK